MVKELIFIYNANSDLFSKASDFAHKLLSPHTYNCSLCAITHGNFSVHQEWADFVASFNIPVQFLYKNDFESLYPKEEAIYPMVYLRVSNKLNKLVTATEIGQQKGVGELINLIEKKVELYVTL
jgi:hypothetical protein